MQITRVNVGEKIIAGISIRTNHKKAKYETHKLWYEFYTNNIVKKLDDKKPNSFIYGVYDDYESDINGHYTITAGIEIARKNIKNNNITKIKKGKYLLFENEGLLPEIVRDTWKIIWNYFEEHKDIKRKYLSDFEVYESDKNIKIYISIK